MADCPHTNKLQRRTQRFVGGEWIDSSIIIGCGDCDKVLRIGSKAPAFYTEDVPRRELPVEPYAQPAQAGADRAE